MPAPPEPHPPHPLYALTSSELARYRHQLEHAMAALDPDAAVQAGLRGKLDRALAEQESRAAIAATGGRQDP